MLTIGRRRVATPTLGRRRHRHRYVGAVAVIAALLGALGSASNAMAAAQPGPKSASGPGSTSASGPGTVTGTVPGTNAACTSHWNWQIDDPTFYGWSEVEWTSNPCGYQIQDKSWCLAGTGGYFVSGIVTSTYLWDRANCNLEYSPLWEAQQRFRSPGGSWSAWKTYWGG
jgi:hypothetical protein